MARFVRMSNTLVHECPGSLQAVEGIPQDAETAAMRRGTDVHALLAIYSLTGIADPADAAGLDDAGADALVAGRQGVDRLLEMFPGYAVMAEHAVDASELVGLPAGSYRGTADLVLLSPGGEHVVVADHKTGRSTVLAGTPQIAGYLLGMVATSAARKFSAVINQPLAADPLPVHERTLQELLDLCDQRIAPSVVEALGYNPRRIPGSHCQQCRAISRCANARSFAYEQIVRARAFEPHEMDAQQLADLLDARPAIEALLSAARDVAADRLGNDADSVPGFRLGRSKAPRRWGDDARALTDLTAAGHDLDVVAPRRLISPAQLISAAPQAADQIEHLLTPAVSSHRLLAKRDALPATERSDRAIERLLAGVEVSPDL